MGRPITPAPQKHRNFFVADETGATYRVTLHTSPSMHALFVIRRDHTGHDAGRGLLLDGPKARRLIEKARAQFRAEGEG